MEFQKFSAGQRVEVNAEGRGGDYPPRWVPAVVRENQDKLPVKVAVAFDRPTEIPFTEPSEFAPDVPHSFRVERDAHVVNMPRFIRPVR